MKTNYEIVSGARELLSDPERHHKFSFFGDADGNHMDPSDWMKAKRFCAMGSLYKAGLVQRRSNIHGMMSSPLYEDLNKRAQKMFSPNTDDCSALCGVNNCTHGREAILSIFDSWLADNEPVRPRGKEKVHV